MPEDTLDQLVALSNRLGDPAHDYVILGEGNTSARADAGSFWVKTSGAELPDRRTIYLQNHGLAALGPGATQVEGITAMAVKAARILIGTHALGGRTR